MRKKVYIYILTASIIAVLITGLISFIVMQSNTIEETKLSAEAMARIIINDIHADNIDFDKKVKELGQSVAYNEYNQYRITIIAEDGTVLGDSIADIKKMDNHSDRAEIVEAKLLGVGNSRRDSVTLKTDMLYVAVEDDYTNMIVRIALPLTELRRITFKLLVGGLISVAAGIVISFIISFIFAEKLSKPINKLAVASYELAGGNMKKRVELKTNTELDILADAFNTMAGRLQDSISEVKHKNAEFDAVLSGIEEGLIAVDLSNTILYMNPIAKDILLIRKKQSDSLKLSDVLYQDSIIDSVETCLSQNKTQIVEVKIGSTDIHDYRISVYPMQYNEKLFGAILLFSDISNTLRLERLRSDFVANVSHELRTPLTSIKGYAETLKDEGTKDNDNASRFLDIIGIEADRLNILINDLMELSEIENKKEDVNISKHSFNEILSEIVDLVSINARKKNIDININVKDDISILANKDRIKQLLLNLVDNAIKYNKEGGKVFINASCDGKMLKIGIKDTGYGIKSDDIPRLFERFYRADKSRSKLSGGTGLGLSIVKHITELYNGSVTLVSEIGVGSEFTVIMPIVIV